MNLAKMTNAMLTQQERRRLYEENVISDLSLVPPFSDLEHYDRFITMPESTGIPVLDQRLKPSGVPNYNNIAYIEISRQLLADNLAILRTRPSAYLRGLADSYLNFFLPSDAYMFLASNREKILRLVMLWSTLVNGRFAFKLRPDLRRTDPWAYYTCAFVNTGLWLIAAYLAAFVLGVVLLWRRRFRDSTGLCLVFVWVAAFAAALIGNHTEVGENNRFRFVLDPLVLVLVGWMIQAGLVRLRRPQTQPASLKR